MYPYNVYKYGDQTVVLSTTIPASENDYVVGYVTVDAYLAMLLPQEVGMVRVEPYPKKAEPYTLFDHDFPAVYLLYIHLFLYQHCNLYSYYGSPLKVQVIWSIFSCTSAPKCTTIMSKYSSKHKRLSDFLQL